MPWKRAILSHRRCPSPTSPTSPSGSWNFASGAGPIEAADAYNRRFAKNPEDAGLADAFARFPRSVLLLTRRSPGLSFRSRSRRRRPAHADRRGPFPREAALGPALTSIVRADLERSGLFRGLEVRAVARADRDVPGQLAECGTQPCAGARWWRRGPNGRTKCGSPLRRGEAGLARRYRLHLEQERARHRHRIADFVYEKLTGEKGVFSHAHRLRGEARQPLRAADRDGDAQARKPGSVRSSRSSSPAWSPDGRKLAYVSFENKKPVV